MMIKLAGDEVAALQQALAHRLGESRYNLWFHNKTRFSWDDDQLTVGVPNHFYLEWVQKTFAQVLADCAGAAFGRPINVRLTIDPELFQAARREEACEGKGA